MGGVEMVNTIRAIIRAGKVELLENVEIPEGTEVLITLPSSGREFWQQASQNSLDTIWDNPEDDVYAKLLEA
jgi:hypothetical protein